MKTPKKYLVTILTTVVMILLTTLPTYAKIRRRHIHGNGTTIAWDSPLGIGILAGIGVFLLLIFLLVVRKMRKK